MRSPEGCNERFRGNYTYIQQNGAKRVLIYMIRNAYAKGGYEMKKDALEKNSGAVLYIKFEL
jgi:hypothetical protein